MAEDTPLPMMAHLEELRKRLARSLIALLVGFILVWNYAQKIFDFLAAPALKELPQGANRLIFTGPSEAFFTYLKVAFIGAIFVTLPYILWQIWSFVAPGLYKTERRMMLPVVVWSTVLFLGGSAFCYFVVFPAAFHFFLSYNSDTIQAYLSMKEYLSFVTRFILAFGLIFQMPLLAYFLAKLGVVTARGLSKARRYALVINFIIAAILTPTPDMVNQLLMAGPLIVLYEVSIIIARIFGRKPEAEQAAG